MQDMIFMPNEKSWPKMKKDDTAIFQINQN